jgi:hypothetical protein
MRRRIAELALVVVVLGCRAASAGDQLERVPTRSGVEVPVMIDAPAKPTAVALLFPGGDGALGLTDDGIAKGADNFMVRTRARFAAAGIVAVVVDVPSDHPGGIGAFRTSAEHADDIAKLVAWARARWKQPVWLVGTSRGTISAADAASRGVAIDGLVLTSTITAGDKEKLGDLPLDKITAPTWMFHHVKDACPASPLAGARELASTLHAHWQTFERGGKPTGGACSPDSHHGFEGLDADVVAAITSAIQGGR